MIRKSGAVSSLLSVFESNNRTNQDLSSSTECTTQQRVVAIRPHVPNPCGDSHIPSSSSRRSTAHVPTYAAQGNVFEKVPQDNDDDKKAGVGNDRLPLKPPIRTESANGKVPPRVTNNKVLARVSMFEKRGSQGNDATVVKDVTDTEEHRSSVGLAASTSRRHSTTTFQRPNWSIKPMKNEEPSAELPLQSRRHSCTELLKSVSREAKSTGGFVTSSVGTVPTGSDRVGGDKSVQQSSSTEAPRQSLKARVSFFDPKVSSGSERDGSKQYHVSPSGTRATATVRGFHSFTPHRAAYDNHQLLKQREIISERVGDVKSPTLVDHSNDPALTRQGDLAAGTGSGSQNQSNTISNSPGRQNSDQENAPCIILSNTDDDNDGPHDFQCLRPQGTHLLELDARNPSNIAEPIPAEKPTETIKQNTLPSIVPLTTYKSPMNNNNGSKRFGTMANKKSMYGCYDSSDMDSSSSSDSDDDGKSNPESDVASTSSEASTKCQKLPSFWDVCAKPKNRKTKKGGKGHKKKG